MKRLAFIHLATSSILAITCLCFPGRSLANTDDNELYDLDLEQLLTVKVETLNKRPQQFMELPAATYIINRQEIENSGALTIPDLLVKVPGVYVKQVTSDKVVVAMRNDIQIYNTNLLVLIDGNPFYNQLTSNALWDILPVAVEDVERIEIVRGDGGTAWGTNSSSGVINIITRSPDSEPLARVNAGGGVDTPSRVHAVTSTGNLRLSVHGEKDSGWADDPSSYQERQLSGRYDKKIGNWDVSINGRVADFTIDDVKNTLTGTFKQATTNTYDGSFSIGHKFDSDEFFVKAFINDTVIDYASIDVSNIHYQIIDFEARYSHLFSQGHRTQFGINHRSYASEIPPQLFLIQPSEKISDTLISGTIDHESRIAENTTLNLGLRYEDFSLFEDSDGFVSYSIRLSHQLTKETVFWGSYNKSYQFPSYLMSDIAGLTGVFGNKFYYQTGNPDLDPEDNQSFEFGMRKLLGDTIFVDINAYYSRVRDEIFVDSITQTVTQLGPNTRIDQYFTNHIESELWGTELLLSIEPLSNLQTDFGFTWFRKKSKSQDNIYRGTINNQYAPEYKISLDSSYKINHAFNISLFLLYEPGHNYQSISIYRPVDQSSAHFRADASLHYKFSIDGVLTLGVKNLFNTGVEWDFSPLNEAVNVEPGFYFNVKYKW